MRTAATATWIALAALAAWPVDARTARSAPLAEITCTWAGAANAPWDVATNWNPNGVPNNGGGNTYNAVVDNGTARLTIGPTIEKLTLKDATIDDPTSSKDLTANQTVTWPSGTMSGLGLVLKGPMTLGPTPNGSSKPRFKGKATHTTAAATVVTMSGTELTAEANANDTAEIRLLHSGAWNITDDSNLRVAGPRVALFWNFGSLTKTGGNGTSTVDWRITNGGTVQVKSGELKFTGGYYQGGNQTLSRPDEGATLTSTTDITIYSGTIGGAGTVKAPKIINDGKVQPDLAPGKTLTFQADYGGASRGPTITDSSVGGPPWWGFSDYSTHLHVTGDAELGGLLVVNVWPGYVPSSGLTFEIMTVDGAMTGAFDNVADGDRIVTSRAEGTFVVHYGGSGYAHTVVLSNFVVATPAGSPVAWMMLAAALAMMGVSLLWRAPALRQV